VAEMFSYYGSKSKVVDLYPSPKFGKIIEPFAGSARYSLKYFDRDVLLVDKYDVIIKIWQYLQQASEKDIMSLPEPSYKESIEQFNLSEGERLLMGFLVAGAVRRPQKIVQKFSDIPRSKKQIASQLFKIRHWKFQQGDYRKIENEQSTWFIDPPYQFGGELYNVCERESKIDFQSLGEWCQSRNGQIIVCENSKANWLPFYPMREMSGAYSKTKEVIWSNMPHNFQAVQLQWF
jgi:site-specific DNA-adenine methylase